MMKKIRIFLAVLATLALCASLQGCWVAAVGAAGAAGGYEAHKHGYEVQSPVKKDTSGGYKPQSPVTHKEDKTEQND